MKIGYIAGAFDGLHLGQLRRLREARAQCDRLVAGVTTDGLIAYRGGCVAASGEERLEMARACRHVDAVVPQETFDAFAAWEAVRFDVLFVGDDWFANARWQAVEQRLAGVGVRIVYLPEATGADAERRAA
jgi:cytidyltransferase-like protein